MIKAVIFDIDGTLLDSFESNFEFYRVLLRASGYEAPTREEFAKLTHATLHDAIRAFTGVSDPDEIKKIWAAGYDAASKVQDAVLLKGAVEAIRELSRRYALAIATNRNAVYVYEPPLDQLKPYFKTSVSYEDTRNHKPDPEPLLLAATQLGAKPIECVYVGDAEVDFQAARSAGMRFILCGNAALKVADGYATTLQEVPRILKTLDNADQK
ncbi:MAG: HAD family hydrolase [Patescibacteria group bacterium]|nr:HAD family hydrolase [Patescibacteria group bacterium]MDE2015057.1 HAD family hydrolase [Patescibacteria group bacterium]